MSFTTEQLDQLLKPINPRRVLKDGKGHPHVSQQDVTAHLIRIFGFGSFDTKILDSGCVFEEQVIDKDGTPKPGRYNVCYRAMVRLIVRDVDRNQICEYEDGSTATAQNQARGDAHDLAYKSSISLATKRAAKNLGDQFGLSLYNKGQMTALVGASIAHGHDDGDVQADVEQQVSLGDESESVATVADPAPLLAAIAAASDVGQLKVIESLLATAALEPDDRNQLRGEFNSRLAELKGKS